MASTQQDPSRWRRRATTIPSMLGATAIAFFTFPLLAPISIMADAVRGRWKWPFLRLYLFLLQYGFNDSVEILLAPIFWLLAGFGTTLDSPRSIARHERLQWWSVKLLERRASQLLGLRVELEQSAVDALGPHGSSSAQPIIVISRHVSLFDASLPGLLAHKAGRRVQAIVMAELLADPGFDLLYGRLGSVFIPRDDGPQARQAIAEMTAKWSKSAESIRGDELGPAIILFPEGRLFTKSVHQRSMKRLAKRDPQRATRLASLDRLLPPKSGGLSIVLDALPKADVVLLNHSGLDSLTKLSRLASKVPVTEPVKVSAKKLDRSTIPEEADRREHWLDQLWLDLNNEL